MALLCSTSASLAQNDSRRPAPVDSTGLEFRSVGCSAGFGVAWIGMPQVVDYMDDLQLQQALLNRFTAAVEFFASAGVRIGPRWDLELEDVYLSKSYSFPQTFGSDATVVYSLHMPTLLAHYQFLTPRAALKLGGGIGYDMGYLKEDYFWGSGSWTSSGLGLEVQCEGHTSFDDHLYSYLAGELRRGFMSDLHDAQGAKLRSSSRNQNVDMTFFSVAVRFGFTYFF